MEKGERSVYIVIILILIAILGAVLFLSYKKDNKQEEAKEEEKLTLTNSELMDYLSYIPSYPSDNKVLENGSVNLYTFLVTVLDNAKNNNNTEGDIDNLLSFNDAYSMLLKRYNKTLLESDLENLLHRIGEFNYVDGDIYTYDTKTKTFGYRPMPQLEYNNKEHKIEDYKINKEELIIKENFKETFQSGGKIEKTGTYEHTFKKNNDTYYWVSTKLIGEQKVVETPIEDLAN